MTSQRFRRVLWGLLTGAWLAAAQGQPASDEALLAPWLPWAVSTFRAPAPGSLEPDLQRAAEELSAQAQARIQASAPQWLADLRTRHGATLTPAAASQYLSQRLVNEIALWYLQPLSPALAEGWIIAATDPRFCKAPDGPSWFTRQAQRWSLLPPTLRAELLDGERAAITRLGEPGVAPARPMPGALEAATDMVERVRRQEGKPAVPMPPVVARRVLAEEPEVELLNLVLRCALNQWWLRERLAAAGTDAAARAAALEAFRFAWTPEGHDFTGLRSYRAREIADKPDETYPRYARQEEITGQVVVRVTLDARGRVTQARVVERRLRVPGLEGRPVAYETALDEAAMRRVRGMQHAPPAEGAKNERTLAMVFTLE